MMYTTGSLPSVHVLVLNWNGLHHLQACLPSLVETNYENCQFVVLDNGSTDGSQAWIGEHLPEVRLTEFHRNLGFTGANNAGMQAAMGEGADYIILLNNDTRVEPDWLCALVEFAEKERDVALCHSQQLTWDGKEEVDVMFYPQYAAGGTATRPRSRRHCPVPTPYAAGCCMMLRTQALSRIGLFDPRYFAYAEDLDLSLRAWLMGYSVMLVPSSVVYHRVGGSSRGRESFWGYRNQLTTLVKTYEGETLWSLRRSIVDRWVLTRYRVALRATLAALAMAPGTVRRRGQIQRNRVRSDKEMFEIFGATYPEAE